jgi:signal transduction histidine kinase
VVSELEESRTNLSEAHARLARAAQLQVAGEIATGIAHQVNNPLTTIIAESYLLAKYLPPGSKHFESVSAIREAAYRAGTVIQRLVDFARARPFSLAPVDVNQSISSATSLLREQIEPHIARLVLDLAADLPPVQGSEKHLQDVWLKLLLNARDAMDKPGAGEISLTTSYDRTADLVQVIIHDNGHGIPAEQLDRIFKPFYTTKDKGTGLGLSICKDVIAKHRGAIRVESTLHEGTTVLVSLPAGARPV